MSDLLLAIAKEGVDVRGRIETWQLRAGKSDGDASVGGSFRGNLR
jgi:hypothetical protein